MNARAGKRNNSDYFVTVTVSGENESESAEQTCNETLARAHSQDAANAARQENLIIKSGKRTAGKPLDTKG